MWPPVPSLAASRLARLTSGLDVEVVSDLFNKSQNIFKVRKFTLAMFAGVQTGTTPSLEDFLFFPQILQGLLGVELGYPKPQASVGWRRGINNAPCRIWPPAVLILLVDLGEPSPLQLTLGAE